MESTRSMAVRAAAGFAPARRWAVLGAAGLVAAAALAFVPYGAAQAQPGHGPHGGPMGGPMEGPMMYDGAGDPAVAGRRLDRMVTHMLAGLDASTEQHDKIVAIYKSAGQDLAPTHKALREAHQKLADLLVAPTIDRAAIEAQRAEQARLLDTVSRRTTQARADAADVLTPSQRAKLAERRLDRQQHRRGPHRAG